MTDKIFNLHDFAALAINLGYRFEFIESSGDLFMPEYKVIAETDVGGKLCVTTTDRARALRHAELLAKRGPEWHVSIETGGKRYHEPRLERIP